MDEKGKLIDSYNALPILEKRRELDREIAEMTLIMQQLIKDLKPDFVVKDMKEFDNLLEFNSTEDDYLTSLYEDIIELKENLGRYCDFATSLYYDDENDVNFDNQEYSVAGFTKIGIIALLTMLVVVAIIVLGVLSM